MTTQRKISKTLVAAKELLDDGEPASTGFTYICHAINKAQKNFFGDSDDPAIRLLETAGMPLHGGAFQDMLREAGLPDVEEERQVWRHAWLDLMIQFCKEEGL